jgi:hypothetical protein
VSTLKYMTILRMVIIVIVAMIAIVCIACIISLINFFVIIQDGWNQLALELYMSSTTRTRFCTPYQYRASWENCLLYPLATQGQFHTI